jgi:hypothetical protein
MILIVRVLILVLLVFSATAGAEDDAALDLLQGYEWQLSENKLSRLGPDAYHAFLDIAQDETQVNFIRARAVTVLTNFSNEEVWEYFSAELKSDPRSASKAKTQRRQLVEGLCDSFLESRPIRVGDVLIPLLETNDVHLKTKIANCLQSVNSVQAGHALAKYHSKISAPWELEAAGFKTELE